MKLNESERTTTVDSNKTKLASFFCFIVHVETFMIKQNFWLHWLNNLKIFTLFLLTNSYFYAWKVEMVKQGGAFKVRTKNWIKDLSCNFAYPESDIFKISWNFQQKQKQRLNKKKLTVKTAQKFMKHIKGR